MQTVGERLDGVTPEDLSFHLRTGTGTGSRALSTPWTTSTTSTTADEASSAVVWFTSSDADYAGWPGTPDPVPCDFCGAPRHYKGCLLRGTVHWAPYGPEPCTCPEAVAEDVRAKAGEEAQAEARRKAKEDRLQREQIQKVIGDSGMGERFLRRTFESFLVTEQTRRIAEAARRYAEDFDGLMPKRGAPDPGRNGLFLSGPPGTGKTHIAAAISNRLLSRGCPVVCMTMIDLLERIKRTFSQGDVDQSEVLSLYKTVPLLVLDDMGKEPPTEWAVSTVYNIVNGRYEAMLPTVVTTNYDTETLIARMTPRMTPRGTGDDSTARATVSRLLEMCRAIPMPGEDWRGR